jgi:hypothetical protein
MSQDLVHLPPRYLTVVIRLPEDSAQRKAITKEFSLFGKFKHGEVSAVYAGDAITENEILETYVGPAERLVIQAKINQQSGTALLEA